MDFGGNYYLIPTTVLGKRLPDNFFALTTGIAVAYID